MQRLQQQHRCVDEEVSCQRTSYSTKLHGGTLLSPQVFCQHSYPYTPLHYHHTLSYSTSTPSLNAITCYHTVPQLHYQMPYYSIISLLLCYPSTLFPGIQPSKNQSLQLIHLNWQTLHEITLYFFNQWRNTILVKNIVITKLQIHVSKINIHVYNTFKAATVSSGSDGMRPGHNILKSIAI